jgi:3-isopropylmalate dehydrogenase
MKYKIPVLLGDGIGPEVLEQSIKVASVADELYSLGLELEKIPCGGKYFVEHECKDEWPKGTMKKCEMADAILKGPVGHIDPKTGKEVRYENGEFEGELVGYKSTIELRKRLELFANVRPVKVYEGIFYTVSDIPFSGIYTPENVDMIFVRENMEGLYSGKYRILPLEFKRYPHDRKDIEKIESVVSDCVITRVNAERVHRFAFELARKRRKKITCVDKSNVVKAYKFFRDIFDVVAESYPDVEKDYKYADTFAELVLEYPENFDVIVGPNEIIDTASDEAAKLQGGRGMSPGANIGYEHAMFEAIHGTWAEMAGKDLANPIASIRCVKMMFEWLGEKNNDEKMCNASNLIERAIIEVLREGRYRTRDIGGDSTCSQVGNAIAEKMKELFSAQS